MPSPARLVAVVEFSCGAVLIYVVAQGKHGAGDTIEQPAGRLILVVRRTSGDVPGTHQYDRNFGVRHIGFEGIVRLL
jgi:hypothetical protein